MAGQGKGADMTPKQWEEAINNLRDPLPMEPELWAAGCDLDTAHFVARQLRKQGYYLVRSEDIGWDQINAFKKEIRKGQYIHEDAGGYFVRAIMAMFGKKPDEIICYRSAISVLLGSIE
jgi:hypothetical protein